MTRVSKKMIKQMKLDAKKVKANKKPAPGSVELGSRDGTVKSFCTIMHNA